jgi:Fe2+ transport system protein B
MYGLNYMDAHEKRGLAIEARKMMKWPKTEIIRWLSIQKIQKPKIKRAVQEGATKKELVYRFYIAGRLPAHVLD